MNVLQRGKYDWVKKTPKIYLDAHSLVRMHIKDKPRSKNPATYVCMSPKHHKAMGNVTAIPTGCPTIVVLK